MVAAAAVLVVAVALAIAAGVAVRRRDAALVARLEGLAARLPALDDRASPSATSAGRLDRVIDEVDRRTAAVQRGAEDEAATHHRLQLALDAVPDGVLIADASGAPVYRNAIAATYRDARHADALVAVAIDELITTALSGQDAQRTLELFGPPKRTLVVSATPVGAEGQPVGALALIEDVTERRRIDAVRRDFVANISHELKTPVGALSLLAETLLSEDDPDVAHRLAERMLLEADRVADTIEDLLALSRIETEATHVRQAVQVDDVIRDAVARSGPGAERRSVELVVPGRSALSVPGDRRQLVSAVYNLLDNAVKYSDEGSTVHIAARTASDGKVELTVADQGMGIPARDLERVFERFYRVDAARHRATGGTGLGLAIVRHVAQNHDGEVRVTSRLGEGSTFLLRLPTQVEVPDVPDPAADRDGGAPAAAPVDGERPDPSGSERRRDGDGDHIGAAGGGRGLVR